MNERVRWMVIALSCALALGCSSSKDTKENNKGDAGGSGNGGNSGNNGNSGGGGMTAGGTGGTMAGGTGGMMGGAIVKNVPCGEMVCAGVDPSSGMMMLGGMAGFRLAETCCADEAAGTCGAVSSADMSCQAPPVPDADCPALMGQPGCCAADNGCGVDASLFGMSCVSLVQISAMIPPAFRAMLGLPDPVDCDGNPIVTDAGMMSTDEDAGM